MKRVVLLAVLAAAVPGVAEAKFRHLGTVSEASTWPLVFLYSDSLPRPKWMGVDVSGYVISPTGTLTVECHRGLSTRGVEYEVSGSGRYWLRPTLAKSETCDLTAVVAAGGDYPGQTLTVTAFGGSKPKPRKKRGRQ